MNSRQILRELKSLSNPAAVAGMARYGINPRKTYGVSIPNLRKLARQAGADHRLAVRLWSTGIHDARILASMIDRPEFVDEAQMESWAADFDSWDVCDECCNNLFSRNDLAWRKAVEWSTREEEFVKRAGFVLMATLAVHQREAPDKLFVRFLSLVRRESGDDRNFVKKSVNWALRQIGKRNLYLNAKAIETARQIQAQDTRTARWIAADALRELTSPAFRHKLSRG